MVAKLFYLSFSDRLFPQPIAMPTSPPETDGEGDHSSVENSENPEDNDWDCYEFAEESVTPSSACLLNKG